MTVVQTVLVFVGAPAAVFAVLAVLVLGMAATKTPRYRPGRGWGFEPVWYLPHPSVPRTDVPAARAITAGTPARTARGGASGSW